MAKRPTYGYRRITAVLNRELRAEGIAAVNHNCVYRIMKTNNLLLERSGFAHPERSHDGKVAMMHSNLRWCSDGPEFTCRNGEIIRAAFLIDACDGEIQSSGKRSPGSFSDPPHTWRPVVNAGISGSDACDMMLKAVEKRLNAYHAPEVIELLSDNGSPYTAKDTRIFARQLGLKPCFTPVMSPQPNGMAFARSPFVKTLKRDYVSVTPLPDAATVLSLIGDWIEDYNEHHPQSGLKWRLPHEFIRAATETAQVSGETGASSGLKCYD